MHAGDFSRTAGRKLRAAFQTRRKTLRNALLQSSSAPAGLVDDALRSSGIDGRRRGETLSVEEFARLAAAWELS